MSSELLHTYLHDHHAGAAAGVDLFRRTAEGHAVPEIREQLEWLAAETEEDKRLLEELMATVDTEASALKDLPARAAQKLAEFKPNQRLQERSPLSDLLELEALTLAVGGKKLGWKSLLAIDDPRLEQATLQKLLDRAEEQEQKLESLRLICTDALKRA